MYYWKKNNRSHFGSDDVNLRSFSQIKLCARHRCQLQFIRICKPYRTLIVNSFCPKVCPGSATDSGERMDASSAPADAEESTSTLLFCRMCLSVYNQAKLLPCLHSFCSQCLASAVTHEAEGTSVVCPVCFHKTKLPPSGVAGVPDNCFLNRMCQVCTTSVYPKLHPQ